MAKTRTLNIRLLREGRTLESAFTERFAPGAAEALEQRPWNDIDGASLHVGQIYSNPPSWRTFLAEGTADVPDSLLTSGAGAVVFLPVEQRIVAVCFGHVHIALNDDAFERQFGLKVTLNSVPRSSLRTLDLATPDAVTFQRRVQASRNSDVQQFGVDMLRDLARVAGGTPRDRSFARFVAGKDSLSITCGVSAATLPKKCTEVITTYKQMTYRTEFSWINNMSLVSERDVVDQLDRSLFKAIEDLRAGNKSNLHMSPPEITNYTDGNELHYNGFGSRGRTYHSLSIMDYVAELKRCGFDGDVTEMREKHRIKSKNEGDEEFSERWRAYDCFVFETTLGVDDDQAHYILFAGSWYRIEAQFKKSIDAYYDAIKKVKIVGATKCANEQRLIAELEANRTDLLKLDQTKINPGGVKYANLEPCDFFSANKHFIHLKDGHSSGPISHLWSQGVVSAEAFVSDREFRKKLRAKVKSLGGGFEAHLPKSTEALVREEYTVVYGIMRKPYVDGSVGLPFFSKISLQSCCREDWPFRHTGRH